VADDTFITLQVPISRFQNALFHSLSGIFCLYNGSVSSAVLTEKGTGVPSWAGWYSDNVSALTYCRSTGYPLPNFSS
jgi:hypothetical protein